MGSTFSLDLAATVDQGTLALEQAVRQQLTYNHYPPIPVDLFLAPCLKAIELGNLGDYDGVILLPEGVTDAQSGLTSTTAQKLIEWAHLDFFITPEDYDPDLEDF